MWDGRLMSSIGLVGGFSGLGRAPDTGVAGNQPIVRDFSVLIVLTSRIGYLGFFGQIVQL